MKMLPTIALASLFLIPAAYAGHHDHKMSKGHDMMDCPMDKPAIKAGLDLSADQKKQIDAIHEEAMKKHKALRDETQQKVLKVLTPEQAKKLQEHRADKMEKHAEHMEKRADKMQERADRMHKHADAMKNKTVPATPAK